MAEALAAAQACGHPVEILDARTETKREWAQPDGTVNAEMHITPEWVADETGGVEPLSTCRPRGTRMLATA